MSFVFFREVIANAETQNGSYLCPGIYTTYLHIQFILEIQYHEPYIQTHVNHIVIITFLP